MRYLLLCLPLLVGCDTLSLNPSSSSQPEMLQPWSKDSSYWSWGANDPILLLGAAGNSRAFLDPDWRPKMELLAGDGGNLILLNLSLEEIALRLETDDINAYRDDFREFAGAAANHQMAIFLNLSIAEDELANLKAFAWLQELTGEFTNVRIGEASDGVKVLPGAEQQKGFAHWQQLQKTRNETTGRIHATRIINHGEIAAEGIAAFNRSVLSGAAAVRHQGLPEGDGFTGAALASIRAVRTVEKHFNFWELRPAPEIIPNAAPNSAYAATNDENGYLLYLPTAGSVDLKLDISPPVPMRVIVIGYLGSQKSEILRPPYGDSFTLFTEEPRGGWMVIKPL